MNKFEVLPYASAALLPVIGAAIWNWVPARKQTRGSTFFGATVTAGFGESSAGVTILRQFRRRLWTWALAGTALCMVGIALVPRAWQPVYSDGPTPSSVICTGDCDGSRIEHREMAIQGYVVAAGTWAMLGAMVAFVLGNRRTRREAAAPAEPTVRIASLAVEDETESRWVGFVDWLAMLGPPAIPAATLIFLAIYRHQASPVLSRRFDVLSTFYGLVVGLCFGTANQWALRFRTRSSDWAPTAAASRKYRTYLGANLAFVFGFIVWQLCSMIVMGYSGTVPWLRPFRTPVHLLMLLELLLPVFAGAMWLWLKRHVATESSDPMADKYWKWGYIYFNPEDSALVVPLRAGVGFSHNFARASVWWVGGAVVAVTMAMLVGAFRL